MRTRSLIAVLTAALLLPASATAAGRLDKRFSGDGLARITRDRSTIPVAVAPADGGALYIAVQSRFAVLRVRPDGRLDRTFGNAGQALARPGPSWDGNARIEALAIRPSDGAVFVAGNARADTIVIAAFDRRGRPLMTFGRGGRVELPMDAFASGAGQLLFDPLSGTVTYAAVRTESSAPWPGVAPDLLLMRATAAGAVTTTRTRLVHPPSYYRDVVRLWQTRAGALRVAVGAVAGGGDLYELAPGAPAAQRLPFAWSPAQPALQLAPIGSDVLTLDYVGDPLRTSPVLRRITTEGSGVPRWVRPLGKRFGVPEIVIPDRQGGAYVAGVTIRGAGTKRFRRVITVMHVRTGGVIDRRFGRKGVLDIHLSGNNRYISTPRLLLDRVRHRLWVVADAGTGFFDIREDFGGHDVLVARIRTG